MKKYEVGYTTGAFDLFHVGHLNILRRSREQCDHLIVGVSTDEVITDYKQKAPFIPFDERMAIVESIRYVDRVVPQTSMDKFQAWRNIKFDVLFHGDDWRGSDMYIDIERRFSEIGVDIVYFPYTVHTSSSQLQGVLDRFRHAGITPSSANH